MFKGPKVENMGEPKPVFHKEMVFERHTKTKPFEGVVIHYPPVYRPRAPRPDSYRDYRGYSGGASCVNVGGLSVNRGGMRLLHGEVKK